MDKCSFYIYGVRIAFSTDDNDFYSFVSGSLKNYQIENEDNAESFLINVAINFSNGPPITKSKYKLSNSVYFDQKNRSIVIEHLFFEGEYTKEESDVLSINGNVKNDLIDKVKSGIKTLINKNYSYKEGVFHHLYRELILLPVFWVLRNKFGKYLMHASAIKDDDKTFVFLGNDGVGKSTVALKLLKKQGVTFYGDNFLLYDSTQIYPFVDSIRINNSDDKITEFKGDKELFNKIFEGANRTHFNFNKEYIARPDTVTQFFVLDQAAENHKVTISEEAFIDYVYTINESVKEFDKYSPVNNLRFLFETSESISKKEMNSLSSIVNNKKCSLLSLKKYNNLDELITLLNH